MKYSTLVKASLAVAVGFVVTAASADIEKFADSFESPTYANGASPTNGLWTAATGDDLSVVTNAPAFANQDGDQYLLLNTDGDTLSHAVDGQAKTDLDAALADTDAGVKLESLIKFVPSDEPNAITDFTSGLKFALYTCSDEDKYTNNLVIAHAFCKGADDYVTTNTVTGIQIDPEVLTNVTVITKKFAKTSGDYSTGIVTPTAFQVKIGDTIVESENAYTADALADDYDGQNGGVGASWFLIGCIYDGNDVEINSIQLKGTGAIDNIKLSAVEPPVVIPDVAIVDGTGYPTNEMANAIAAAANYEITFKLPWTLAANADFSKGLDFDGGKLFVTNGITLTLDIDLTDAEGDLNAYITDTWNNKLVGDEGAKILIDEDVWTYTNGEWKLPTANYPTYITDAAEQELFDAWATRYNATDASSQYEKEYLLNIAPDGTGALSISAIEVDEDVVVTIKLDRGQVSAPINGVLKLYGTASLDVDFAPISDDVELTDATFEGKDTATATFSGEGAKFFKAVIEKLVPANAANPN